MMAIHLRGSERVLAIVFLVAVISAAPGSAGQGASGRAIAGTTTPLQAPPRGLTGNDIIAKLLEHNKLQNARLLRYSVVRTYEVRNDKGKLAAQTIVWVDYRAPSEKSFHKASEKGSWVVRHLVFDRLISAETETSSGREHHDSAITTGNYRFTLLGEQNLGPYDCFVVKATPRRKDKYLFDGRIWIDAQDFALVRIAGHPAKKLSFWIHRVDFVRQYQRIGGFWLPYRDETFVDVRFYGKRVFTIDHRDYSINDAAPAERHARDSRGEQ